MKSKEKHNLLQWFCLSGILGLLFYILHMVIGAMYYPGYDWMRQAVSDLTAANAPSREIANRFADLYTLFSTLCCTLVCVTIQDKGSRLLRIGIYLFTAMNWISAIGYSLFPLSDSGYAETLQDIMHVYVVTILVVVSSIASLILIFIAGLKDQKKYISLGVIAAVAFLCMLIGAVGTGVAPKAYFGIVERFSTISAVAFTAVLGLYGFTFFDRIDQTNKQD